MASGVGKSCRHCGRHGPHGLCPEGDNRASLGAGRGERGSKNEKKGCFAHVGGGGEWLPAPQLLAPSETCLIHAPLKRSGF